MQQVNAQASPLPHEKKVQLTPRSCHWLDESCLRDARVVGEAGRILGVGGVAHSVVPRLLQSLKTDRSAVIKYRRSQAHENCNTNACPRSSKASTSSPYAAAKRPSKVKLLQSTGTLLLHVGFDTKFDSALQSEDAGCMSHRLLKKASLSGHIKLNPHDFAKLEAEVLTGECTLQYSAEGELERIVPLEVLRLERQDGRVYTRVGMWERNSIKDQKWHSIKDELELPGRKRSHNEDPVEVINRVILDEIPAYKNRIFLRDTAIEVVHKESYTYGVRTRYKRTVHTGVLEPQQQQQQPSFPGRASLSDESLVPSVLKGGNKVVLYGWISEAELHAAQAEESQDRVREWMHVFQQRLEDRMSNIANATRGRRKDDCVRKLAYLTWWRAGKPQQTTQARGEAWDIASRIVDETCTNGTATQEELLADYEQSFAKMAVDELIQDSSIVQVLKDCLKT